MAIETHKNPQVEATNRYETETDDTEKAFSSTHDIVVPAGHAYKDQKIDKHGLSPVHLGSGEQLRVEPEYGLKDIS